MKIGKERFDAWAKTVWNSDDGYTASRAATTAGISKSSFFFQRSKDYVESSVIIALARALKLEPLNELLKFDEFETLSDLKNPSDIEVLSQVGPEFLMEELVARLRHEDQTHFLESMPEPNGLKRWLDAVGMYGKYEDVAQSMELANIRVLSKKINENRLNLGQLVVLCNYGNLNARFGMVVTGNLTLNEAGFDWNLREQTLRKAPGSAVIESLWSTRKWLEKSVQVKDLERNVYESFG